MTFGPEAWDAAMTMLDAMSDAAAKLLALEAQAIVRIDQVALRRWWCEVGNALDDIYGARVSGCEPTPPAQTRGLA